MLVANYKKPLVREFKDSVFSEARDAQEVLAQA
jgi:hypothetical protein